MKKKNNTDCMALKFVNQAHVAISDADEYAYHDKIMSKKALPKFNGTYEDYISDIYYIQQYNEYVSDGYRQISMMNFLRADKGSLLMMNVLRRWCCNKQVFKVDNDFMRELLKTESLKINKNLLLKVPFDTFYLDISNIEGAGSVYGMFIKIYDGREDVVSITILPLCDTPGKMEIKTNTYGEKDLCISGMYVEFYKDECIVSPEESIIFGSRLSSKDLIMAALQFVTYIASEKPDIVQNELTVKTYRRPSSVSAIKNKFSEVQMWDVGVRIGNEFRKSRKLVEASDSEEVYHEGSTKRPHVRRAHWHRYRIGKGRKEVIVKWLPPTTVNCGQLTNGLPAVIHAVK